MAHVRSTSMAAFLAQVRRIPTPLAITIGVLVGLLIANMLPGNVSNISKFTDDNTKIFIASRHPHGEVVMHLFTKPHAPRLDSR